MKLKNKICISILGVINLAVFLSLLITIIPNQVPITFGLHEEIIALTSKWILIIPVILPLGLAISICLINKDKKASFFLKILFVLSLYENTICLTYLCLAESLEIGAICEVPISLSIFLPIAIIFLILSIKLKNVPYLSRPALNFKCTKETEFIWKQTHFFARDAYFLMSFCLIIVSVVFSFFRLAIIELGIFVSALIICTIVVYLHSRSLYKTYKQMKDRQDALGKKNEKENKN